MPRPFHRTWPVAAIVMMALLGTAPSGGAAAFGADRAPRAGAAWSEMPTPPVHGGVAGVGLSAISCVAALDCIAVGSSEEAGGSEVLIAEHLDDGVWTMLPRPPLPRRATGAYLEDVSCVGPTFCMATGSSSTAALTAPLAERFDGSTWTVVQTPDPAGDDAQLAGVSCTARSFCVAVGSGVGDPAQLFAETFDGSRWRLSKALVPRGSDESDLSGVSCRVRSCVAVGSVAIGTNVEGFAFHPLIERETSSGWRVVPTHDPTGSLASSLQSVSCPRGTECVAVGSTTTATSIQDLTDVMSGTTWTQVAAPSLFLGPFQKLHVRCRALDECTAVGGSIVGSSVLPVVEHFDGSTWRAGTIPPSVKGYLLGVACFVPACVAVGGFLGTQPLALIG